MDLWCIITPRGQRVPPTLADDVEWEQCLSIFQAQIGAQDENNQLILEKSFLNKQLKIPFDLNGISIQTVLLIFKQIKP